MPIRNLTVKLSLAAATALLATAASSHAASIPLSESLDGWEWSAQRIGSLPIIQDSNVYASGEKVGIRTVDGMFGSYSFTLSRTVTLMEGERLVGQARFGTFDTTGPFARGYGAHVYVGDDLLWSDAAGNLPAKINVPPDWLIWGRWDSFSFTAPSDGDYTLRLVVDGAQLLASFGELQGVAQVSPVPDPLSTLGLLTASALGLVLLRRRD